MSFQTLPLPPAVHYLLVWSTWPAPPPYSPGPHQLISPSVFVQILFPQFFARLSSVLTSPAFYHLILILILILPVCDLTCLFRLWTLPFNCSFWICLLCWLITWFDLRFVLKPIFAPELFLCHAVGFLPAVVWSLTYSATSACHKTQSYL